VRDPNEKLTRALAFLVLTSTVAGCSGASDMLSMKDAEWFSRPGRLFIRNVSIDTPPLTPDKPITADDLVSAEGGCPGMAPAGGPANANASSDGAAPVATSSVALGHTECDVVRGIGAPDSVNVSGGGDSRVATVTWLHGPRSGIYTFTGGRLSSIEKAPDAGPPPKVAKPKGKRRAAT
jgi:hypothetical protein